MRMSPSVRTDETRSFIRFTDRSRVDLPQPEGPIRAVTSPRGTPMLISKSAWLSPYHSRNRSTSTESSAFSSASCVSVSKARPACTAS